MTHRSADSRKGPVHDVRHAPQRGRPHRGRAAVRLLTQRRYCSRLERRGVVGVVGVRLLHHVAWNTRPQTVAHSTQKLDSRTPAVIKAMQAGFDPCIVCQISSLLGATDQHSTTQSSYLCVSVDSNNALQMAEKGEQVWMDHLYTSTQTSVKTLHGVICTRRIVTHRKPCGTAMLAFVSTCVQRTYRTVTTAAAKESGASPKP